MIEKRHILELRERVSRFEPPVLSLYATVNPGSADTNPQAVLIRVKNALRRHEGLPPELVTRVLEFFDRRPPQSRSLVVFADAKQLDVLELQVQFLNDASQDQVELHYGEAYFTPLLVAIDEHEPYAVAYADRDRLRVFQLYMGQIEQILEDQREPVADEQDDIQPSKSKLVAGVANGNPSNMRSGSTASIGQQGPSFVADRGDAADQLMQESIAHSQSLFYKAHVGEMAKMFDERGIQRVILMGPDRDTHKLLEQLPKPLAQKVVAVMPSLTSSNASAAEVLARVTPKMQEIEAAQEQTLIDQIRERGMWGLDQCLTALQEGRLHTIAVPGDLHQGVFVEATTQYVALSESKAHDMGGDVKQVDLAEKLPDLAAAGGARLEFVHGEAQRRLIEEFGGMAGLRRW